MRLTLSQQKFLDSDAAIKAREELKRMVLDPAFNTQPMYSSTQILDMPFEDQHMNYMCNRPKLDPEQYLANLRLKTRKRS